MLPASAPLCAFLCFLGVPESLARRLWSCIRDHPDPRWQTLLFSLHHVVRDGKEASKPRSMALLRQFSPQEVCGMVEDLALAGRLGRLDANTIENALLEWVRPDGQWK
jgi:hypothetical protein